MKKRVACFSLIELMVVVAIISILAVSGATIMYKRSVTQSKFASLVQLFESYSRKIAIFYDVNGALPSSAAQIEPNAVGSTILGYQGYGYNNNVNSTLARQYGVYDITYCLLGGALSGKVYSLSADPDNTWNLNSDPQFNTLVYLGQIGTNGGWLFACGTGPNSPIDFSYLPAKCQQVINTSTLT